jgi:ribose 5-phosphate isomerase B
MIIALGSDHAGFEHKHMLAAMLRNQGYDVLDFGTDSPASVDYPDYALRTAQAIATHEADYGVLVCGSGIGVSITANKIQGIRAANCITVEMAQLARKHNNANVVTLGQRLVSETLAQEIVSAFLHTAFEGGRHEGRVAKIHSLTGC